MIVALMNMIEEDESCLMQHSALRKIPTLQRKRPLNLKS